MTRSDLEAMRTTFATATADPASFFRAFRDSAVRRDPSLAPFLPSPSSRQAGAAVTTLTALLDRLDGATIAAEARALAQAVSLPGIQPRHYSALGRAFLDTIIARAAQPVSDAARCAWADAFVVFAEARMARCYNPIDLVA